MLKMTLLILTGFSCVGHGFNEFGQDTVDFHMVLMMLDRMLVILGMIL